MALWILVSSAAGDVPFQGRQLIKMSVGAGPRLTEGEEAQTIHFLSEEEKDAYWFLTGQSTQIKTRKHTSSAVLPCYG